MVGELPDHTFHAELAVDGGWLRFTFDKQRITPRPQQAILAALLALLISSGVTAWLVARHISRPVTLLADGALQISSGSLPCICRIARSANSSRSLTPLPRWPDNWRRSASQMTLMAGISHDLRSPLARLRMAVGMLGSADDSEVLRRMEIDIAEMNRLIAAQMELTRAQQAEAATSVDIGALLREVADGAEARLPGSVKCPSPIS